MSKPRIINTVMPKDFHTVLKLEATLEGKTMTKYMSEIARDATTNGLSISKIIKERERQHEKKKFTLQF